MRKLIYIALLGIIGLMSCEDPIDVNLETSIPQLTVDALITDEAKEQTVRLTISQEFFSNAFNPAATGATVVVTDLTDGIDYSFTDADNDGNYTYDASADPISKVDHEYALSITYDGNSFSAFSETERTIPIDSIGVEFRESSLGEPEGYYGSLHARDKSGPENDFYWIRTYKWDASDNEGFWLNKPGEINISADGTFSPNAREDNFEFFEFILPIREGVNPIGDEDDPDDEPPYSLNDSLYVELHGITEEMFYYLLEIQTATVNGGLFATPLSNVPTNIVNNNTASDIEAVGWFGMSSVSTEGRRIE